MRSITGAILVIFLLTGPMAGTAAGQTGLNLYGLSYHSEERDCEGMRYESFNPGAGLLHRFAIGRRSALAAYGGVFRDSLRNPNGHLGAMYLHRIWGPLEGGGTLLCSWSKTENNGRMLMAPLPMLSLRHGLAALNLTYFPSLGAFSGLHALGGFVTLYPFGSHDGSTSPPPPSASAADSAPPSPTRTALEFQVEDLLELESFRNAILAVKWRFGARHGLRLGLQLSLDTENWEYRQTYRDTLSSVTEEDSDRYDIEIFAQYLAYTAAPEEVAFFVGIGPLLGYEHRYGESLHHNPVTGSRALEATEANTWRYGLALSAGVEWSLRPNLAVTAEYALEAAYSQSKWRDYYSGGASLREQESEGFDIGARAVRLGLSVYFR